MLQLATLADPDTDLVAVRSEGAQDVDLKFADGRERYVQLKDRPRKRYGISSLAEILAGFVPDWLDAGGPDHLSFELVASSGNLDDAVAAIEKDGLAAPQSAKLVEQIAAEPACERSPAWAAADEDARKAAVEAVVERTTLAFRHGPAVHGGPSFDDTARVLLTRVGVDSGLLDEACAALRSGVRDGETATADTVTEILTPFVVRSGLELFDGAMRAVDEELLARGADEDRQRAFLRGSKVTWEVIASDVDVPRDQAAEVLDLAREEPERLRMVIVGGGPGNGKSTLLRRVGATLAREGHTVLYLAAPDASPVQRLEAFCAVVPGQVVVLVDAIFNHEGMLDALEELEPSLPVTFVSTANGNEYVEEAIAGVQHVVELKAVSDTERERLLDRLEVEVDRLETSKRDKLMTAPSMVAIVQELYGEGGEKSQRKAIEWLARRDPPGYEIYARVAFCSRVGISVPAVQLIRNWGPVERQGLRGLVDFTESRKDLVNAGHPTTAATAWKVFAETRDPLNELRGLVAEADTATYKGRRFQRLLIGALFRAGDQPSAEDILAVAKSAFEDGAAAMTADELMKWLRFWASAGEAELSEASARELVGREPRSGNDLKAIVSALRREGKDLKALELLETQLAENYWAGGRGSYVRLARLHGTLEQRRIALERTSRWLIQHPSNPGVRTALLKLASEEEDPTALQREVAHAIERLAVRPNDRHVRAAVLHAAANEATDEQVRWLLDDTRVWLRSGPEAPEVWRRLSALAFARGSDEDVAWIEGEVVREHADPAILHAVAGSNPAKSTVTRLLDTVNRLERGHERSPANPELLGSVTAAARRLRKLRDLGPRLDELLEEMEANPGDEVLAWRAIAYADALVEEDDRGRLLRAAVGQVGRQPLATAIDLARKARQIVVLMPRGSPHRNELFEQIDATIFELAAKSEGSAPERLEAASFLLDRRRGDLAERLLLPRTEEDPKDLAARELLARSLLRRDGSAERSLEHWTWLMQIPPHAAKYRSGRAQAWAILADEAESKNRAKKLRRKADRDFGRALERWTLADGSRDEVLRHRAWVQANLGDHRALTTLGEIKGPIRSTVSARLALATAYVRVGDLKRARRTLDFLKRRTRQNMSEGAERKIEQLLAQIDDLSSS